VLRCRMSWMEIVETFSGCIAIDEPGGVEDLFANSADAFLHIWPRRFRRKVVSPCVESAISAPVRIHDASLFIGGSAELGGFPGLVRGGIRRVDRMVGIVRPQKITELFRPGCDIRSQGAAVKIAQYQKCPIDSGVVQC